MILKEHRLTTSDRVPDQINLPFLHSFLAPVVWQMVLMPTVLMAMTLSVISKVKMNTKHYTNFIKVS